MKIVYIHQYYVTPQQGGAIRSYHLSKLLAKHQHEVEMVTAHNERAYKSEIVEGVKVHYIPVKYDSRFSYLSRIISFLLFTIKSASFVIKNFKDADLVYATSTPLTVGISAIWIKKKTGIPYYFEVRDLWPEAPVQMGVIKNVLLKKLLYGLENKIYGKAEKIIALSPAIKERIVAKVKNKEVVEIPNISDCEYFKGASKSPGILKKYGIKGDFVVAYTGALGPANNPDFLLEIIKAANQALKGKVQFIIAGSGKEAIKFERKLKELSLENTIYLQHMDKAGIREILSVSDASYISYADKPILSSGSPNKFFDSLAAGKLCIINFPGWIKDLVEKEGAGFYADPYDPESFVKQLQPFIEDKELLYKTQEQAFKLAREKFSLEITEQKFIPLFK